MADQALRSCVQTATKNKKLAGLMFDGVRLGGGPYYYTPYRWGYGWPYGRAYSPLTETEQAQASALQTLYIAHNPALACMKEVK